MAPTVCQTCLASDRRLVPVRNIQKTLLEVHFSELVGNNGGVCWECDRTLLRFSTFKSQVTYVQRLLRTSNKATKFQSLSTLKPVTKNAYDLEYAELCDPLTDEVETFCKPLVLIKEEPGNQEDRQETNDFNLDDDSDWQDNSGQIDWNTCRSDPTESKKNVVTKRGNSSFNSDSCNSDVEEPVPTKKAVKKRRRSSGESNNSNSDADIDEDLKEKYDIVEFTEEEMLRNREEKRNGPNYKKIPYKCDLCVLGFTRKENYDHHLTKKHDKKVGKHSCPVCATCFPTLKAVQHHRAKHYTLYRCRLCKHEAAELCSIENHCRVKHKGDTADSIHCQACSAVCNIDAVVTTQDKRQDYGRRSGRGRGSASQPSGVVSRARAQRRITKGRQAKLDRRSLLGEQRAAQRHRVLLPDAPPRKRPAQRPSPERMPCEFVEPEPATEQNLESEPPQDLADPIASASYGTLAHIITARAQKDTGSDDDDLDVDMNKANPSYLTASDQQADNSNVSPAVADMLRAEEELNDRVCRELSSAESYFVFEWSEDSTTFSGQKEAFTGTPGPTFPVTDDTRPTDVFYKMFNDEFVDMMVVETNRYAAQTLDRLRRSQSKTQARSLRWTPTNRDEMLAYLALVILQGLYPKVKEESYFSYDGFGTTPYFARIMSYNRYHLLKMMQHFFDNEASDDTTKLNKIRPVIDYLNDKFASLYLPGQEVVIDESLLKYHGRLSFTQKISTKAAGVGVKTYELCESSTGYLWAFRVYTGKDGPDRQTQTRTDKPNRQTNCPDGVDTNAGGQDNYCDDAQIAFDSGIVRPDSATAKIVYDLMGPLLHKGHTLIMDNFYNSPLLARCLKLDGRTDVYGTLRLTREFVPKTLKSISKADLRQGEVLATYTSDLALMLWRDSNLVSMLSTYHCLQIGSTNKHNRVTYKPRLVLDYNKHMGGVDRKDQVLASQPLERQKNKVWYKKLFRHLFNDGVFNCFVLFTSNRSNKITHRQFRTVLAEDLIRIHSKVDVRTEPRLLFQKTNTVTRAVIATPSNQRPYVADNHFPIRTGLKNSRCWFCTQFNNRRTRAIFKCEECQVNLCLDFCFKAYHKPN